MSIDQKQTQGRSEYEIEMDELTEELREQHLGFMSALRLNAGTTDEDED